MYLLIVSPIPARSCLSGALIIILASTSIASGIVHLNVFLALPSVPSTATGEARLSLLRVVGSEISSALLTNAANFARSSTVPPPNPITT